MREMRPLPEPNRPVKKRDVAFGCAVAVVVVLVVFLLLGLGFGLIVRGVSWGAG